LIDIVYDINMARIQDILNRRRRDLGLSQAALAVLTNTGKATIQRLLAGENAELETLQRVLEVLGLSLEARPRVSILEIREAQARKKARALVGLVQGSAGLEAQAVDDAVRQQLEERTAQELLAGSNRQLWAS